MCLRSNEWKSHPKRETKWRCIKMHFYFWSNHRERWLTKIKKFGLGASGQKVKIWPKILDFPACNTVSLARRRSAQRKTLLVGNQVGIQTIIATLALSKWASLSVVVLFRRGVKSAAELSVQLAPSSQIVALEAMWCDAEGGQTAGEIVPLEGSIQSRAWSRLLFQAFKGGFRGLRLQPVKGWVLFKLQSWELGFQQNKILYLPCICKHNHN